MSDARTLASVLALVGMVTVVAGQEPTPNPSPAEEDEVAGLHLPQTAEDHLALADDYVKLAAITAGKRTSTAECSWPTNGSRRTSPPSRRRPRSAGGPLRPESAKTLKDPVA